MFRKLQNMLQSSDQPTNENNPQDEGEFNTRDDGDLDEEGKSHRFFEW
jgi:hypothetical protein